jgi:hypothetical protein
MKDGWANNWDKGVLLRAPISIGAVSVQRIVTALGLLAPQSLTRV